MKTLTLTNAKLMKYKVMPAKHSCHLCFMNELKTIGGRTARGVSCKFAENEFNGGQLFDVTYHITRAGSLIIDEIKEVVESDGYDNYEQDEFFNYCFKWWPSDETKNIL